MQKTQMNGRRTMGHGMKCVLALTVLLFFSSPALFADSVFITGSVPPGTTTPFSETDNGLTATFTSPADPGGFEIGPSFFSFGPQILVDPGPANGSNIPLDIAFSAPQYSVTMSFGLDGAPGPFVLDAYLNGVLVGTVSTMGVIPNGYSLPEGTISFSGTDFNSLVLTSPTTPYFAIANIDAAAPAPEPSSLLLLGSGLLGIGGVLRRKLAK
jgi:hypothetical protein